MKSEICPICDGDDFKKLLTATDYSNTKEAFDIVQCTCGMTLTYPAPKENEIEHFYTTTNYISHKEKSDSLIDSVYLQVRKFTLRWKLSIIKSVTDETELLDFGCGAGEFLKHCLSRGYRAKGYEPTHSAAELACKKTQTDIATRISEIDSTYSVITLWHVLEHVHRLNETLGFLRSRLKPHGTIFIAVPNHKSYDASKYAHYWAGYDVPRHLWHFDRLTMHKLTEKHNLLIKKIIPMKLDPYYISLVSEQYKSPKKNLLSRTLNAIRVGWKSNLTAKRTGEYSSLIYVIQHA
jgi:2-polyprenyl-3-methyl-5-hydroxy-6-metoxy-1,4-benzoquinol methylase